MASILSGISAGAHQGLANLVASKRGNRQMARDQRRYENQLTLQLGAAASEKQDREKMFAYRKTRDAAADDQWAEQMGLRKSELGIREDTLAESKRSNMVRETHASQSLAAQIEQHDETAQLGWETHNQRIDEFDATQAFREETAQTQQEQFDAGMQYKWDTHGELLENQDASLAAQVNRDETLKQYYNESVRIREAELNRPLTDLEKRETEADIQLKKSQAGYYDRRTAESGGGTGRTSPSIPWGQSAEIAKEVAVDLVKEYTDFGHTPWTGTLPWDDPSGKNQRGTQPEMLNKLGTQTFLNLMRRFGGDPQLAQQQLEQTFDAMLADESFGDHIKNDIISKHPSPTLSDREKLEDARRMFLTAWRTGLANALNPGGTTGTTPTPSVRDMQIPEKSNQMDFRNRGVR